MQHAVVSQDEWLRARAALLAEEKAQMRAQDALAEKQRALPWVEITKPYTFEGEHGPLTLAELFAGKSQLFVKHFMIAPDDTDLCVGCSLEVDNLSGVVEHLNANDISLVVVAPVGWDVIRRVREHMGWRMPWVSSLGSDFSPDLRRAYMPEGAPAAFESVFYKDEAGRIFLTWATSGRGAELFLSVYRIIDVMPKGRQEAATHSMIDWVRPHPDYGRPGVVANNGRFRPA